MRIAKLRTPLPGRVLAVAAVAAGGIGASILPVSADVADQSPSVAAIRVESPASLLARGAAIAVPVTVVCQPGARAFVIVRVTQNSRGSIANGANDAEIPSCTGGFQNLEVNVPANNAPFRRGVAFGSAELFVQTIPSGSAVDEREIRIVRDTDDSTT